MLADKSSCHIQNGWTALIMAVRWNHEECVRLLVEAGADKSSKDKTYRATVVDWAQTDTMKDIFY